MARVSPLLARPRPYVAGFLAFVAVVALLASRSYLKQQTSLEEAWHHQLQEMANLKAGQVAAWRAERLGDAAVAVADTPLMPAVRQVLTGAPAADDRQRVLAWMAAMRANYRYANVALVDATGRTPMSSGELFGSVSQYAALARDTPADSVVLRDVPGPPAFTRPHLCVVVGLRDSSGSILGTLLLGIDPSVDLYRSTLTWPATRTGEVVLVRADGDAVRYLSPTRHASVGAMAAAESRNGSRAPIARAALTGRHADGTDGAGVLVLAAATRIPDSPWVVVAAIDSVEAFEQMREPTARLAQTSGTLVLICGAGIWLAWRHQRSTFERQRREDEIERHALRGHYEFLTRFGNDAITLVDGDGRFVEVNDRAVEWFGYSREEFLTMHVSQLRGPDTASAFEGTWETLKRDGRLVFETVDRRKDGSLFPVEVSARYIEIDGRPFCQSILRDISERRRAEAHIHRVNRLYAVLSGCSRAIVEARTELELFTRVCGIAVAQGGFRIASISLVDAATGAIVRAARAGEGAGFLDGIAVTTAEGPFEQGGAGTCIRERRAVIVNDMLNDPALAPWRAEAERHGLRSSIALPLRRFGHEIGVLGLHAAEPGFFDEAEARLAEEVADSVSFALDGLEQDLRRRQADAELRVSRDRLERVLDAIDEGYWDWHPATGELHLSPRYHTMLGYMPGEIALSRRTWLAMTHPEDAPVVETALARFFGGGQDAFTLEYRVRCKSGQYIWVLSRAKVVSRDSAGAATRLVGTQTDITARKQLEDQFLQSQKLESVGRLAGGVAHDFNNLLTVINGYSEIVLGKLDAGDPNWPHLHAIRQAGDRAASLTHQLLAFSRKQATQPRALRLNDEIAEFEPLLRRLVGEEIEVVLRLDATADRVVADPSHLHQVIINLVVNARDAMPSGGRVLIHTANARATGDEAADVAPGPCVVLSVTDTGTGMDEATRAQIFEPFFTTKEHGKGTGLGLSMVYGVVRQSGGFIRVASQPGAGTTFAIYLPQTTLDVAPVVPGARPRPLAGSETILVVDDQAPVRGMVVEALRMFGYSVLAAADGAEALQVAARHPGAIHVLLTDVGMPGLDGRAVAERLAITRPNTKVIYTSGYTDDVTHLRVGNDVGVAYLPKPYSIAALGEKIRDVLHGTAADVRPVPVERRTVLVVDDDEHVRQLLAQCLDGDYRVFQAGDGEAAMEIVRREPGLELLITDLFMPKQEGVETIRAARDLRPGLRVIAISGAFGGKFLSTAERLGVEATLLKPIPLELLRQTVTDVLRRIPTSGIS